MITNLCSRFAVSNAAFDQGCQAIASAAAARAARVTNSNREGSRRTMHPDYVPVPSPDAISVVVMRGRHGQPEVGHPLDPLRHDVDHALLVLKAARDDERGLEVDDEPRLLEEPRPDDRVRKPRLVLQRDEAESL